MEPSLVSRLSTFQVANLRWFGGPGLLSTQPKATNKTFEIVVSKKSNIISSREGEGGKGQFLIQNFTEHLANKPKKVKKCSKNNTRRIAITVRADTREQKKLPTILNGCNMWNMI